MRVPVEVVVFHDHRCLRCRGKIPGGTAAVFLPEKPGRGPGFYVHVRCCDENEYSAWHHVLHWVEVPKAKASSPPLFTSRDREDFYEVQYEKRTWFLVKNMVPIFWRLKTKLTAMWLAENEVAYPEFPSSNDPPISVMGYVTMRAKYLKIIKEKRKKLLLSKNRKLYSGEIDLGSEYVLGAKIFERPTPQE